MEGVQVLPSMQDTQLPFLQTRFVPQRVPLLRLVPASTQEGVPVLHDSSPSWHGLAGTHAEPALQASQSPSLHTRFEPHELPFGAFPESTHTEDPVSHETTPVLHGVLGVQGASAVHAVHSPWLHTWPVPQAVPLLTESPVSPHSGEGEHTHSPV